MNGAIGICAVLAMTFGWIALALGAFAILSRGVSAVGMGGVIFGGIIMGSMLLALGLMFGFMWWGALRGFA